MIGEAILENVEDTFKGFEMNDLVEEFEDRIGRFEENTDVAHDGGDGE